MRSPVSKAIGLAASLLCLAASCAWAQAPSRDKLVEVIRKAKILKVDLPLSADIQGNEAQLVTLRSPVAKDNDCKIDAMLMAKALMQAYPGQIMRLKVQFGYSGREDVDEVTVTAGEVKAYGAGAMSESELLATLDLQAKHVNDGAADNNNNDSVKPGPAKETRMLIVGYIEELRGLGTDVKPFEARLKQIEDSIGKADSATIKTEANDLKRRLTDEETLIQDARNIQKERPIAQRPEASPAPGPTGPQQKKVLVLKNDPRFNAAFFRQVREAVTDKRKAGQDVREFEQQLKQINELRRQEQFTQAQSVLDALANQVGVHLQN